VGNNVVGSHGNTVQLRGMSFWWSQWQGQYYTEAVVNWLVDDWQCSLVRAVLGIWESSGYLQDPETEKAKVELVVNAAIAKGIYVIIDWHDHHAEDHVSEAMAFFDEMALKYGKYPNVIFETYNDPLAVSWSGVIKPYHEQLVPVIRAHSDNLIVLGNRNWCQHPDEAAMDPVPGWNLAYTIHFWASTHKQSLRNTVMSAKSSGVAIFATMWGTCEDDGDGTLDLAETDVWLGFLAFHGISYANWAVSDKQEACSALVPGASTDGGWPDGQLTASGRYVREAILNGHEPVEPPAPTPPVPSPGPTPPPSPVPTPPPAPTPPVPSPSPPPSAGGGCCRFEADCGDCGEDGTGWCHESAANCDTCIGHFDPRGSAPNCGGGIPMPSPGPMPPPSGGGCCRFGEDCGDCGDDGTGWCHVSAYNCATCTGSFDPSGPSPGCR